MKSPRSIFIVVGALVVLFVALFLFNRERGPDSGSGSEAAAYPEFLSRDIYWQMMDSDPLVGQSAVDRIAGSWRPGSAIMLLHVLRWQEKKPLGNRIRQTLAEKLKLKTFDWDATRLAIWAVDYDPHPELPEFLGKILALIDLRFGEYFYKDVPTTIRLDQIQWGGVRRDGIPPLREPKMLAASEATYLNDTDVVFGVEINGDVRAYPKRILAWHELFRDTIGQVPLAGVYCTLCGTMIVYEREFDGVVHDLGTSGFLFQSNKLMYDRETTSLWSTMTGQPVVGALVGKGIALRRHPVVTTTWGEWKHLHPETTVLSLDTGHTRDYGEDVAYADYFGTDRIMFPVPKTDDRLKNKAEILGLRSDDGAEALAISVDWMRQNPVVHDQLAEKDLVVITDPGGANRAYNCGEVRFAGWDGGSEIIDADGKAWAVTETGLTGSDGQTLSRIPAHRSFWFGWYAAFPDTRLIK